MPERKKESTLGLCGHFGHENGELRKDLFEDFLKVCTLMCIHPVVVTGLGRAQRIAQTKLDKRLLSAHRWASVNHTFSTSIHIDFFSLLLN